MKVQRMPMSQSEETSSGEAVGSKPIGEVSNTLLCTDAHVVYTLIGVLHTIAVLPLSNWPHTVNATPQVSVAHQKGLWCICCLWKSVNGV